MLWEQFLTVMNSVALPAKIVVKNHSHPAPTLTMNGIRFNAVSYEKIPNLEPGIRIWL